MECIGKVRPGFKPVKRSGQLRRRLDGDARQASQTAQGTGNPDGVKTITGTQHPFGFKQYGRANKDIAAFHDRSRCLGLFRIVVGQQAHDHIGINRAHAASLPP